MVAEKMKLKILEAISEDLAKHIDSEFSRLTKQREVDYDLDAIIEKYLNYQGKPLNLINSNRKTKDVVDAKRDIAFIYYCLSCPFYFSIGVDERLSKEKTKLAVSKLNISRAKFPGYLISAKHYYRVYAQYREIINEFISSYIKKE